MKIEKTTWCELMISQPKIAESYTNPPRLKIIRFKKYTAKLSELMDKSRNPRMVKSVIDTLCKFPIRPTVRLADKLETEYDQVRMIGIDLQKKSPNRLYPIFGENKLRPKNLINAISMANICTETIESMPARIFRHKHYLEELLDITNEHHVVTYKQKKFVDKVEIAMRAEAYITSVLRHYIYHESKQLSRAKSSKPKVHEEVFA
jgi:hypothetical protein